MAFEADDTRSYIVLINEEGQYSIWPERLAVPKGWRDVGFRGSNSECSAHVDGAWLDMRPASLAREMDSKPAG